MAITIDFWRAPLKNTGGYKFLWVNFLYGNHHDRVFCRISAAAPRGHDGLTRMLGRRKDAPPEDIAALTRGRICECLLREVEAMATFAMGSGIKIPAEIMISLDRALSGHDRHEGSDGRSVLPSVEEPPSTGPVEAGAPARGEAPDHISRLAAIHPALAALVAPAKPATLVMLNDQRRHYPRRQSFGAIPIVRRMLVLAVLFLALMLGVALSVDVNAENMSKGLLDLDGFALLVNEIFLAAAAGVGATLANLKRLDIYVSACNYEPRYESSYWTRLVLGVISGVILSQVLYRMLPNAGKPPDRSEAAAALMNVGQPILAILGGFSADLLNDILSHLILVVRNAFGGGRAPASQASSDTAEKPGRP
jgi:hypothetical protein